MQNQRIIILSLSEVNFPAWVGAISLQAGALGIKKAIDDPTLIANTLLVRTLASLTNAILESVPCEGEIEAMHGNPDVKLHPLLRHIHSTYNLNPTLAGNHETLELKATSTVLLKNYTLDDYFMAHRTIRA